MGWDKSTIIRSDINTRIEFLKELGVEYKLTELGRVIGRGYNDGGSFFGDTSEDTHYPIRRLEYKDVVILEKMRRTFDCDEDDILESHKFEKGKEPKDWKIVVNEDEYREGEMAEV